MEFDSKSWAITGVAAVVIIGLVWWGIASRHSTVVGSDGATTTITMESDGSSTETAVAGVSGTQASVVSEDAMKKEVTAVASGETVTTQDQAAGETVAISQATLKSPSWIAIKDTTGRILGAGWFAQSGENLSVPLLRATKAGDVYQAVIYADDGDKKFDFHADTLLTSSEGAPVSSTFRAQ